MKLSNLFKAAVLAVSTALLTGCGIDGVYEAQPEYIDAPTPIYVVQPEPVVFVRPYYAPLRVVPEHPYHTPYHHNR